ncbi:MAG: ClC family H(+)/Cl(-) exchange transporter [Thomasclavelia sp.]|jgi:H+/Cl- antiporter ClcA|nr:ClC family H(+)/Cl(-) exchange transporter [Thomasclavelia sp.]
MISNIKKKVDASKSLHLRLLFEGCVVGGLAGCVSIVYRLCLTYGEKICDSLIVFAKENYINFFIWILVLIGIVFIVAFCLKKQKYISGSGIPQVEAEVKGKIDQPWFSTIFYKIIGGTASIVAGLSLGREGPSIQLGAMAGKGFSKFFKIIDFEERYLLTCGAAAGLAAAFNAPLAGIMFALEEIHKNFSASTIISVMCASLTGSFVSSQVFGLQPIFHFDITQTLPLNTYLWILILGIITGILGVFYNYFTEFVQNLFSKIKIIDSNYFVIIPIVMAGILAMTFPYVLGGGHKVVALIESNPGIWMLMIALVIKFLFSIISFASGAPGGIFFPLLIIGSLIGNISALIAVNVFGLNPEYINNFIILGMTGYFAAIVRAPLTGIILLVEMSGTLTNLMPVSIVAFASYIVASVCNSTPIYESLLDRLLKKEGVKIYPRINDKETRSFTVDIGSLADGCKIKDISWPKQTLLVSIVRGEEEILPSGEAPLYQGDIVVIMYDKSDEVNSIASLNKIFSK